MWIILVLFYFEITIVGISLHYINYLIIFFCLLIIALLIDKGNDKFFVVYIQLYSISNNILLVHIIYYCVYNSY